MLPEGREARSRFLLRAYGAPDLRQADGVGGGTAFTNKVVIVKPSARPDADVDYTHAQVDYTKPNVDWNGTCGNCSSVPGPYAIHAGWVKPAGDVTRVRIFNTNTEKFVLVDVPTPGGVVAEEGDTYIDGVPFPGPLVRLGFHRPAGSVTGKLFPSGRPLDEVETPFGRVRFTLIDAANPFVFAFANDLGLSGGETVAEIDDPGDARAPRIRARRRLGADGTHRSPRERGARFASRAEDRRRRAAGRRRSRTCASACSRWPGRTRCCKAPRSLRSRRPSPRRARRSRRSSAACPRSARGASERHRDRMARARCERRTRNRFRRAQRAAPAAPGRCSCR